MFDRVISNRFLNVLTSRPLGLKTSFIPSLDFAPSPTPFPPHQYGCQKQAKLAFPRNHLFSRGLVALWEALSVCPSVRRSVRQHESKSGKTCISAPTHPSATGIGRVSDLVPLKKSCQFYSRTIIRVRLKFVLISIGIHISIMKILSQPKASLKSCATTHFSKEKKCSQGGKPAMADFGTLTCVPVKITALINNNENSQHCPTKTIIHANNNVDSHHRHPFLKRTQEDASHSF